MKLYLFLGMIKLKKTQSVWVETMVFLLKSHHYLFFFQPSKNFRCVGVLLECMCTVCMLCLQRPQEGDGSLGTRVTDSCEPMYGCQC